MQEFEKLIDNLDLKLFEKIGSQTTDNDKRSILVCQKAIRNLFPNFVYLEIGSYLGGSLQPWFIDNKCKKIYSIDKRPQIAPDERGDIAYAQNSTNQMLKNLAEISQDKLDKLTCIDGDVSEIDTNLIKEKVQACFIDGEHTDEAAWRDFQFCLKTLDTNGVIFFHDAAIIYKCLDRILEFLKTNNYKFQPYFLADVMFVIEIGDFPLHNSPDIKGELLRNYVGYLTSMQRNDYYRAWHNKDIFKFFRKLKSKMF